jgi:hypothetical protein
MHYYTGEDLVKMLNDDSVTEYAKRIFREALKMDADVFPHLGERFSNYLAPTLPGASQG